MLSRLEIESAYEQYKGMMMSYILERISCFETAEDLVQDVFANAIEKRDSINSGTLKAFLIKSLSNALKDYHKKSKELLILDITS